MEEILKLIAAGGGIGVSATWAYWLWRLEPRFKALEEAIYTQSKVDLLRLTTSAVTAPELREVAAVMAAEVQKKIEELQSKSK